MLIGALAEKEMGHKYSCLDCLECLGNKKDAEKKISVLFVTLAVHPEHVEGLAILHFTSKCYVYPRALVDEFRVRQAVSDVGVVPWNEGDIDCATFGVVAVLCASYGIVQCLAAETAVYPDGLAEMRPERFQHLLAKLLEVVYFFRVDAVLDALLCCCLGAEHLF